MPMNGLLSSGCKEDLLMTTKMVVGSAFADDCVVKPLTSSTAKGRKRLFIGCIPIESIVGNVQLHFSQFSYVLDVYLPKVKSS